MAAAPAHLSCSSAATHWGREPEFVAPLTPRVGHWSRSSVGSVSRLDESHLAPGAAQVGTTGQVSFRNRRVAPRRSGDTEAVTSDPLVLLVEDDSELRTVVGRGLREEGFLVETAGTGAESLERIASVTPDVLIVDVGLPDTDGRDLCQALRARGFQTPVLFLTARDALVDRIAGFDAGGDDYLAKPFAFVELVARVQALVRRGGGARQLEAAGLQVDPVGHTLTLDQKSVALTPTEFRVLACLLSNAGETVRRRELVRAGWPHGAFVRQNTLDAYIARLRRKLRSVDSTVEIATVHGIGYRFQ
jgi:two-component system, OmpR family, response regulator